MERKSTLLPRFGHKVEPLKSLTIPSHRTADFLLFEEQLVKLSTITEDLDDDDDEEDQDYMAYIRLSPVLDG
ncbi:hypothetical protein DNTS_008715 [Danionella cerebrum]|uniref:Uncharacterized protein n=1 Tax=Danionella cerebrum TaxID=2873325 RepID=A0A553NL29_9TELE|nr:hypothetical protein DNTS_008715 [Danionella translucida]